MEGKNNWQDVCVNILDISSDRCILCSMYNLSIFM